jgi:hypothetical protein
MVLSNPSVITIPSSGPATPYPSSISSDWCPGTITDVNVSLHGFGHPAAPYDVDIVLRGPTGLSTVILSDVGSSFGVEDIDLFIDDEAGTGFPTTTSLSTGTFRPTDADSAPGDFGSDTMPAPAPSPNGAALSVFDGSTPVGNWELFVADDFSGGSGDLEGGWGLRLEVTPETCPVTVKGGKVKEGSKRTFTLSRTGPLDDPQIVSYATKSGSAKSKKDFKPASGDLTFAVGEATKTVTVKTKGDGRDERNEKFALVASAGGVTSQGTAKIKDND